jgi:hypothetical protein
MLHEASAAALPSLSTHQPTHHNNKTRHKPCCLVSRLLTCCVLHEAQRSSFAQLEHPLAPARAELPHRLRQHA